MSDAPVIRCRGLSRWYGEVQGLSGLDLEVDAGVVGLLGPNGSGKSTFMRLLTGLIRPSRGSVELFGQRVEPGKQGVFARIGHAPGDDIHLETERAVDFLALIASLGGDSRTESERRVASSRLPSTFWRRMPETSLCSWTWTCRSSARPKPCSRRITCSTLELCRDLELL